MDTSGWGEARRLLAEVGLSATRARLECLSALMRAGAPLGREELMRSFSRAPDRVTVYRTLKVFERAGLIRRAQSASGREVWCLEDCEHGLEHCPGHMHFECLSCGARECIRTSPWDVKRIVKRFFAGRRRLELVQIEARGLCRGCLTKRIARP